LWKWTDKAKATGLGLYTPLRTPAKPTSSSTVTTKRGRSERPCKVPRHRTPTPAPRRTVNIGRSDDTDDNDRYSAAQAGAARRAPSTSAQPRSPHPDITAFLTSLAIPLPELLPIFTSAGIWRGVDLDGLAWLILTDKGAIEMTRKRFMVDEGVTWMQWAAICSGLKARGAVMAKRQGRGP
jgi:hypothetical protein